MKKRLTLQEQETIAREYRRVNIQDMFTPEYEQDIARYYSMIFGARLSSVIRVIKSIKENKRNTAILDDKG